MQVVESALSHQKARRRARRVNVYKARNLLILGRRYTRFTRSNKIDLVYLVYRFSINLIDVGRGDWRSKKRAAPGKAGEEILP